MSIYSEDEDAATLVIAVVAKIVTAYVANNKLEADELPQLIAEVHNALHQIGNTSTVDSRLVPAVDPRKSVKPDHIVCLEDGLKFKTLKRHLTAQHGMTPREYRSKWGLPHGYPMTAPDYAHHRSEMAKSAGLGSRAKQRRNKSKRRPS